LDGARYLVIGWATSARQGPRMSRQEPAGESADAAATLLAQTHQILSVTLYESL